MLMPNAVGGNRGPFKGAEKLVNSFGNTGGQPSVRSMAARLENLMLDDSEKRADHREALKAPQMSGLVIGALAGALAWMLIGLIVSALT